MGHRPENTPTPRDSHHPGPPRFVQVGDRIADPIFVDGAHGLDRDNLAPTVAGTPRRDPDDHAPGAFAWSVASRPAGSSVDLAVALPSTDGLARYDHGLHAAVEFEPDVPGTYVLALDAPDGTHELTIRAFEGPPPDADDGDATTDVGGPPRIALDGRYDPAAGEFVVGSEPELAPDSRADNVAVEFLPHDASALDAADIETEGTTARIPATALDGPTGVYAAPFDGDRMGVTDQVVLDPRSESVSLPNRPPEWLDDAVVYEIFTRSFAGQAGATDFSALTERVPYLAALGVDVIWLTPILPAWSPTAERPPGGPHGYSVTDYFDVAADLGTLAEYDAFVATCHDHDIRVCFDLPVNHCGWPHPFFQETIAACGPEPDETGRFPDIEGWDLAAPHFDWFDRRAGPSDHDAAPAHTSFFGVRLQPNLNYHNVALREHILSVVEFWAERVDMFRCDIAWGVPHSFWKEVRERVRAADSEFALLDETIPRQPAFAASEFDLHFDTHGFTDTVQAVARGERPPEDLLEAIEARQAEGLPRYARVLNATENHDEPRLYHEARGGHRDSPAAAQRGAIAAAVTLPGVPMLYYGQERLVSEHGTRRPRPFEDCDRRSDDIEADPYKRAFVNWARTPEEHLQFYRDLLAFYHDSPALHPDAELARVAYRTDAPGDVFAFGREAGTESRVVVVNFAAESRRVDLPSVVDTRDRFTGEDVGAGGREGAVTVDVDRLAVLPAPSLTGTTPGDHWR